MFKLVEVSIFSTFFVFSFIKMFVTELIDTDTLTYAHYTFMILFVCKFYIESPKTRINPILIVLVFSIFWSTLIGSINMHGDEFFYRKLKSLFLSLLTIPIAIYMLRRDLISGAIVFSSLALVLLTILFSLYGNYNKNDAGYILNNVYLHGSFLAGFLSLLCLVTNQSKLLLIPLMGCIIVLGGRGPFFALIVVYAIIIFSFWFGLFKRSGLEKRTGHLILLILPVITILFYSAIPVYFHRMIQRMFVLFTETGGGGSGERRLEHLDFAISAFVSSPALGVGFSNYGMYISGFSNNSYPHNFILELVAESGLIGTIPVLTTIGYIFYKSTINKTWPILLFVLLSLSMSYTYTESNELYFALTTVLVYRSSNKNQN
jgi:O-antigen ligase